MDIEAVNHLTFTDIRIRPQQYTDLDGLTTVDFRVDVRVDTMVCGHGTGKSLGEAIVAAGLDMMGVEADLLLLTMDLLRKQS